jgi:hypothetical protein
MSDITITIHNPESTDAARVTASFEEGTDVMVVVIHRQHGVVFKDSYDCSQYPDGRLVGVGARIMDALEEAELAAARPTRRWTDGYDIGLGTPGP